MSTITQAYLEFEDLGIEKGSRISILVNGVLRTEVVKDVVIEEIVDEFTGSVRAGEVRIKV